MFKFFFHANSACVQTVYVIWHIPTFQVMQTVYYHTMQSNEHVHFWQCANDDIIEK